MIKINLAKRRKGVGGVGAGGFDLKNLNLTALLEKLKGKGGGGGEVKKFDISGPIPRIILAAIAIFLLDDQLTTNQLEALAVVDAELAVIDKEKTAIQGRLNKIKGFEPVKKQLEADEIAVRTKLEVIGKLLENRNAPAKMLMQIAQSIPDEVWLTDLKVDEKSALLKGATPGYNQVADFIKALSNSSYLNNPQLSNAQENTSKEKDQRLQSFEIKAARR